MCGRKDKKNLPWKIFLLLFLAPLFSATALAKTWSFSTGIPFGLGFQAGISQNPSSNFLQSPQSAKSEFSQFYGFEPFLEFGKFQLRFSGQLQKFPNLSHRFVGTQSYTETSDTNGFVYGVHLLLFPFVSQAETFRTFLKLGAGRSITKTKNVRNYDSGMSYTERLKGKSRELLAGLGLEFFFVQNYSLQLEGGYRSGETDVFRHEGGTDLRGNEKFVGESAFTEEGVHKTLKHEGVYAGIGLNLNF